jgi:hypothetical protein
MSGTANPTMPSATERMYAARLTDWQDAQPDQSQHHLLPEVLGGRNARPHQIEALLEIGRADDTEACQHGLQVSAELVDNRAHDGVANPHRPQRRSVLRLRQVRPVLGLELP